MQKHRIYFTIFGLVSLCTLIAQFMHFPDVVNFFSFFTIISNILTTGVFFYVGLDEKRELTQTVEEIFGATVVYMSLTGIGYWSLLNFKHFTLILPLVNVLLHGVMPVVVFIGWLIYDHKYKIKYKVALEWLTFPILYLIYTLTRGMTINWYPYPFVNPHKVHGYGGVLYYVFLLSFGFYAAGLMVIWIGNNLKKRTK